MGFLSNIFSGVDDLVHNAGSFLDDVAHGDFKGIDDDVRGQRDVIMENPSLRAITMPVLDYFTLGLGSTAAQGWYNKSKTGHWGVDLGDIAKGIGTNYALNGIADTTGFNSVPNTSWSNVAQNTAVGAGKGAAKAAINGGDIGQGALSGGIGAGIPSAANYATTNPFTTFQGANDQQTEIAPDYNSVTDQQTEAPSNASNIFTPSNYSGASMDEGNPFLDYFSGLFGQNAQGQSTFAGNTAGQLASGLMGIYSGYQQKKKANQLAGSLQQLYSPNSPYAQQLQQTLARKDAAAGRRSQYGPRATQLAAALTQGQASLTPRLAALGNSSQAGTNTMLRSLGSIFGGRGGPLDRLGNYALGGLSNMFSSSSPSFGPGASPQRLNEYGMENYL